MTLSIQPITRPGVTHVKQPARPQAIRFGTAWVQNDMPSFRQFVALLADHTNQLNRSQPGEPGYDDAAHYIGQDFHNLQQTLCRNFGAWLPIEQPKQIATDPKSWEVRYTWNGKIYAVQVIDQQKQVRPDFSRAQLPGFLTVIRESPDTPDEVTLYLNTAPKHGSTLMVTQSIPPQKNTVFFNDMLTPEFDQMRSSAETAIHAIEALKASIYNWMGETVSPQLYQAVAEADLKQPRSKANSEGLVSQAGLNQVFTNNNRFSDAVMQLQALQIRTRNNPEDAQVVDDTYKAWQTVLQAFLDRVSQNFHLSAMLNSPNPLAPTYQADFRLDGMDYRLETPRIGEDSEESPSIIITENPHGGDNIVRLIVSPSPVGEPGNIILRKGRKDEPTATFSLLGTLSQWSLNGDIIHARGLVTQTNLKALPNWFFNETFDQLIPKLRPVSALTSAS